MYEIDPSNRLIKVERFSRCDGCIDVVTQHDMCVYDNLSYPSNWYGTGLAQAEQVREARPTGTAQPPSPSLNLRSTRELRHRPRLIRSFRSPVRTQKDPERPAHHHGE